MLTYPAYVMKDANDEEPIGTIWWDGKHTRASSDVLLQQLKRLFIPFGPSDSSGKNVTTIGDGKDFFDRLPMAFRNGYTSLKRVEVDSTGKVV